MHLYLINLFQLDFPLLFFIVVPCILIMLKSTIETSMHSLLHVSVHPDHPQGAYADPC
jgi:hypothetical protein